MPNLIKRCPFCGEVANDYTEGDEYDELTDDKKYTVAVCCRHCGCVGPWAENREAAKTEWDSQRGILELEAAALAIAKHAGPIAGDKYGMRVYATHVGALRAVLGGPDA